MLYHALYATCIHTDTHDLLEQRHISQSECFQANIHHRREFIVVFVITRSGEMERKKKIFRTKYTQQSERISFHHTLSRKTPTCFDLNLIWNIIFVQNVMQSLALISIEIKPRIPMVQKWAIFAIATIIISIKSRGMLSLFCYLEHTRALSHSLTHSVRFQSNFSLFHFIYITLSSVVAAIDAHAAVAFCCLWCVVVFCYYCFCFCQITPRHSFLMPILPIDTTTL